MSSLKMKVAGGAIAAGLVAGTAFALLPANAQTVPTLALSGTPRIDEVSNVTFTQSALPTTVAGLAADTTAGEVTVPLGTLNATSQGTHGALQWSVVSGGSQGDVTFVVNPTTGSSTTLAAEFSASDEASLPTTYSPVVIEVKDRDDATAYETVSYSSTNAGTPGNFAAGGDVLTGQSTVATVKAPLAGTVAGTVEIPGVTNETYTLGGNDNAITASPSSPTSAGGNLTLSAANTTPALIRGVTVTADNAVSGYTATAVESMDFSANGGAPVVTHPTPPVNQHIPFPKLSHGHAQYWAATREHVYYTVSDASAAIAKGDKYMFTIVGPNFYGQHGYVPVTEGLNTAAYEGLAPGHGYTVYYTLVNAQGVPVDGANNHTIYEGSGSQAENLPYQGYVYFVSNTHYGSKG